MKQSSSGGAGAIRGLALFIGDVRNCQTKDQEEKTVYKEMAKIRSKFQNKGISGYDKKKYVWKLIYMHILGYDVDFGHDESLNLINSGKFSEKCTGYIATGIMLNEKSDQNLFERVMNAIKVDLTCGNELCEALALSTIGNIGSAELAKDLSGVVIQKVFNEARTCPIYVRKRACLVLLSFLKRYRSIYNQEKWASGFKELLQSNDYGLLLSATSLIQGTINIMGREGFSGLVRQLITIIANINNFATDYYYYMTACPWLQIKVLKLLQSFPAPQEEALLTQINTILLEIINKTEVTKNVNKNNSDHAILFEAINLIIHYKNAAYEVLRKDIVTLLGRFIEVKEPNIRYLALDTMSKLQGIQVGGNLLKQHLPTILISLRDPDISIRRRALDLMFCLCDQSIAGEVVNELLDYLQENDYELKEEMVLKIAILAEKFAENLNWYIDVIIKLIEYAGDYVSEDIWYRVAQIVTGFGEAEPNQTLQKYAALKLFDILQLPSLHESMIKIGAYVLSEFGILIADKPGKGIQKQFEIIHKHFYNISTSARGILLTAYMKMLSHCPQLKADVIPIFEQYKDYWDEDIQQRSCEYLTMLKISESDPEGSALVIEALAKMPNFSDSLQTNSILTRRIMKLKVQKGFSINEEEAEKNVSHNLKNYETNVSNALSTNNPSALAGINLEIDQMSSYQKPKPQKQQQVYKPQPEQQQMQRAKVESIGNLLDIDDQPPQQFKQQQNPIDILADLTSSLTLDKNDVTAHKFYMQHADRFSPQQTVQLGGQTLDMKGCVNPNQWKALLPISSKEGVIYEDQVMEIHCQFQTLKFLARLLLTFKSKQGGQISDIQMKLPLSIFGEQLDMQCSPVKYSADSHPQAIVMVMLKESIFTSPHMKIQCLTPSKDQLNIDIRLPLFINRFTEPVDMPIDNFNKYWDDITHNRPSTFQKLDAIIKNPAPPQVPHTEVLKKMMHFFTGSMNLKAYPPDDVNNFWVAKAVGEINFKPPTQQGYPSNPNEVQKPIAVPVMMEAEFFKEDTSEFKVSIRSSDSKQIAIPLMNFLKFFINPQ